MMNFVIEKPLCVMPCIVQLLTRPISTLSDRSSLLGSKKKTPEIVISELHLYFTVTKIVKYAKDRK